MSPRPVLGAGGACPYGDRRRPPPAASSARRGDALNPHAAPHRTGRHVLDARATRTPHAEPQPGSRRAARQALVRRAPVWRRALPSTGAVAALVGTALVTPLLAGSTLPDAASATPTPAAAAPAEERTAFRVFPEPEPVTVGGVPTVAQVPTEDSLQRARERASREAARPPIPGCDPTAVGGEAANGRLDTAALCRLPWDERHLLRADAASALARLNAAYAETFGGNLVITDSYRSYSAQVSVAAAKPGLAARPGTSEHGWALAVDLGDGVEGGSGDRFAWLTENAHRFGWDNPEWARKGGSGPYEPWHWEFVGTP